MIASNEENLNLFNMNKINGKNKIVSNVFHSLKITSDERG
ncbi:Hypothetical protein ETEE_2002 [Edwardsiella anguillarum ET080813]|uniref:Uncharacterized protein n=1 Tax=Edwardsiella anguillarum ET080813 TaxID=667120 RepID=A0A076LP11_9GAMM|nr:Hypothetical protein ETEE_2002 [Edwardsiella anguillarum ET080813]